MSGRPMRPRLVKKSVDKNTQVVLCSTYRGQRLAMVRNCAYVRGPGRIVFGVRVSTATLETGDDSKPRIELDEDLWLFHPCGPRQRKWLEREVRRWAELLPEGLR